MRSLLAIAFLSAAAAWLVWELVPVRYSYFSPSHEQPYHAFLIETFVALAVGALLLLVVVAVQRQLAGELVPWFKHSLAFLQIILCAGAAVSGIYATTQLAQMRSALAGRWGSGDDFWLGTGPVAALAISPWLIFLAGAVLAAVSRHVGRVQAVAIVVFDILALAYVAFVFANAFAWACVTCSGPAG